jgi:hypothetical protein
LISFADPDRPNHGVAVEYFRHCLAQHIPMWLSVVAAGEFAVGEPVTDLPLQNFRIHSYNLLHAIRAAAFYRALRGQPGTFPEDRRPVIINDLKILAQAEEEQIPVILSEDVNTLSRFANHLRQQGNCSVRVLLLSEGFTPGRLVTSAQDELRLPFSPA